jgi:hypothetical protein
MKSVVVRRLHRGLRQVGFRWGTISFVLLSSVALTDAKQKPKATATPTPALTTNPSATAPTTPTPKPSSTPDTKIDARMEAELLQAEDRFINAIRNHDVKELEGLLHPYFADSLEGASAAISKRGVITRVADGRLPAYQIEKERKLIRSGDAFTVEGLGKDTAHALTEDNATEHWAFVRRLWSRENGRWIATAQIIAPLEEKDARERLDPEKKEKQPN